MNMRVAIWRLLVDLIAETFEADGKLLKTLPIFLLRPGQMVRDYVQGRRASYTSPVRLLVFALAIGFLCFGIGAQRSLDRVAESLEDKPFVLENGRVVIEPAGDAPDFEMSVEPGTSFEKKLMGLNGMNQRQAARVLMDGALNAAPTIFLLLIPWMALALELLYPRYLVIEHLLLSVLLHAQGLLLLGVSAVLGWSWFDGLVVLWLGGQLVYGMRVVYGKGWPETLAKWVVLGVFYLVGFVASFVGLMLMVVSGL